MRKNAWKKWLSSAPTWESVPCRAFELGKEEMDEIYRMALGE